MRTALVSVLVVVCSSAVAAADPCKQSVDAMVAFMDSVDALGHDAVHAALNCALHGPDDAGLQAIQTRFLKVLRTPPTDPPAACVKNSVAELSVMVGVGAHAMGERFGIMFRQCSSKAQARVADLRKKGKTDDEIAAAIQELLQPVLDQVK